MRKIFNILSYLSGWIIPAILFGMLSYLTLDLVTSDAVERTREHRASLDQKLRFEDELRSENRRLRFLVETLQRTDALDEKIAREEANLVAPGDLVFVFPPAVGGQ